MHQYWPFSGLIRNGGLRDRLIVSLDLGGPQEALRLVDALVRHVRSFKVGKLLYRNSGPDFIREIRRRGGEVFLDLKFHNTPAAVCRAAIEATRLGVKLFDLHPSGSREVMERTRVEVNRVCRNEGLRRPHILAVTMLAGLRGKESPAAASSRVVQLARLAADAALDGVVTSAAETRPVRAACGRRFIIVASGLGRTAGWDNGWGELSGAADTLRLGADYIVVGGPIWRAAEPTQAVRAILEDMERGLRSSSRGPLEVFSSRPI